MKNLAKLNGVKALNKNEQKSINGGRNQGCRAHSDCPGSFGIPGFCRNGICIIAE